MNPNSLFSQCINFISKNIICVDSLVGFPEIIGKDIFHKVCSDGNLLNHNHRGTFYYKKSVNLIIIIMIMINYSLVILILY